jgi:ATP-dependent RNA helicase RhlE
VVRQLAASGIAANAIHGNKSQPQRERALTDFRSGRVKILVATDIAARGIDVAGVSHVINFELPNVAEQYVHRIGRTARAGKDGIAIAFCGEDERGDLRGIEKLIRQRINVTPPPAGLAAEAARLKAIRPAPAPASERPRHDRAPGGNCPSGPGRRPRQGQTGRFKDRVRPAAARA